LFGERAAIHGREKNPEGLSHACPNHVNADATSLAAKESGKVSAGMKVLNIFGLMGYLIREFSRQEIGCLSFLPLRKGMDSAMPSVHLGFSCRVRPRSCVGVLIWRRA
jgi:hypothetical protein